MKIRTFRLDDYDSVKNLWIETGLGLRPGDDLEEIKLKLERDPDLFLVAEEGGRIVGSVLGAWDGRRGWIYHLGVTPAHQREGVASELVRSVESRMRKKGAVKINAIILESNEPSMKFFAKNGYEILRVREATKSLKG